MVCEVVDVGEAEQLGDLVETLFGERDGAVLFVDGVVAGGVFFARLFAFDDFAAHQLGNDAVDLVILVGGFLTGAGDDQRGAGFVDQDGVDFVDDGVVVGRAARSPRCGTSCCRAGSRSRTRCWCRR